MKLFKSEDEVENIKKQLIEYFNLKQEQNVVTALRHSKLEFRWCSHDNWNGGFDIYELYIEIPMEIYVKLENEFSELTTKIQKATNNLIRSSDEIGPVSFQIQSKRIKEIPDNDLLNTVEKIKAILIGRATGQILMKMNINICEKF